MSEPTYYDAALDAALERIDRETQIQKASIIGSAVEMDRVIQNTDKELRLKIMKLVANLIDAGLELSNPHCHKDLPEQTKEMVIELAQAVKTAIEDYISE